jgi:hypothetical protein
VAVRGATLVYSLFARVGAACAPERLIGDFDMDMPADFPASHASVIETMVSISAQIWDAKYRLKDETGAPVDLTVEDTWRRVARALAATEREPARWEAPFYEALRDFRFVPAGRIISGAGTARRVTLFNCFVMGDIEDDLGRIFAHLREAALTMQQGGGIGYDFSSLRPKGAAVRGVGADASGPLSFMDVWDSMCRTIMSAGARRGAMMATMRCDHPDVEAFIAAKREPGRLRNFNLSVLVTDDFMRAVEADAAWDLVFEGKVYRTLQARALWEAITRATYDYAEPGVIFIDRINKRNNLHYATTSIIARRSTRPIPAASSRCRPMAPACSARSTSPGWCAIPSAPARGSTRRSLPNWSPSPSACWMTRSTPRASRWRRSARRRWPSGASASA